MSDAPILVIGASGKTGRHLTAALRRQGIDHLAAVHRLGSGGGSPEIHFDWTDESTWVNALANAKRVYLVKPPPRLEAGTAVERLIQAAPSLERIVLLSEMNRENKPANEPNRAAELAVLTGVPEPIVLRPNWFFQNWSAEGGYCQEICDRGEIILPTGDATASLIDMRDVVDVALHLLLTAEPACVTIDLTGAELVSMPQLADAIGQATGRSIRHVSSDLDETKAEFVTQGLNERHTQYLMDLYTEFAEGHFARISDGVEEILGRPPRSLSAFIGDHVEDWCTPLST